MQIEIIITFIISFLLGVFMGGLFTGIYLIKKFLIDLEHIAKEDL